jgi:3-(3-hydroxy-phenyl)propionate hydroxylase
MEDLKFEQRWLVIDVASMVELDQDCAHQVCDRPLRHTCASDTAAGFRLLEGETAADLKTIEAYAP